MSYIYSLINCFKIETNGYVINSIRVFDDIERPLKIMFEQRNNFNILIPHQLGQIIKANNINNYKRWIFGYTLEWIHFENIENTKNLLNSDIQIEFLPMHDSTREFLKNISSHRIYVLNLGTNELINIYKKITGEKKPGLLTSKKTYYNAIFKKYNSEMMNEWNKKLE